MCVASRAIVAGGNRLDRMPAQALGEPIHGDAVFLLDAICRFAALDKKLVHVEFYAADTQRPVNSQNVYIELRAFNDFLLVWRRKDFYARQIRCGKRTWSRSVEVAGGQASKAEQEHESAANQRLNCLHV